jgi:hypothetical protein
MRFPCLMLALLALVGLAATPASRLAPLVQLLATSDEVDVQKDVLRGMEEAFRGRRQVAAPEGWSDVARRLADSKDAEVRQRALRLSLLFGSAGAIDAVQAVALDGRADAGDRHHALQAMIEARPAPLPALLRKLLDDPVMRGAAIRGLAAIKADDVPT